MGIWPVYGIHLLKASEKLDLGIFEKEGQRSSQTFRYKNQVKAGGQQAPKHVSQQRRGDHECVVLVRRVARGALFNSFRFLRPRAHVP
ncbi:hypothetical protein PC116_g3328 [Phytophthora cactorum]|uniref:Uncharacterized protein n=1 Tax=Phytophthora cactorum TaxID=29920 RepID=A0A8T1LHK4_9STRA|nr:hypothetical protein Pcac1_g21243 [Phytophthora cactorum]KAG2922086.1 hypothetical protein PC114_g5413 [Phytophthora cactorum]KAG2924786.1 hypothetical protein PC117_g15323 [Phytophthora cactorum]KAG3030903.1 hypothetical protein PC120_g3410 [Phytophthora cactorum]KAG3039832.1 hypothetical protein PC119_g1897 [Phytophthora cactorum]